MQPGKKIYFISDLHFGAPNNEESLIREKHFVRWLDKIADDAEELFIVGDLFDFWFEYKRAVPKGYIRALGKLALLADSGIKITLFTGNHDMWIFDYIPKEIGCELYRKPITREFNGKKFYIGHGDGLGPGDHGYKFIKKVFENKICQWLFERLHPNFGLWLADSLSKKSRMHTGEDDAKYLGDENEWLVIYSKQVLEKEHFDYFIFGHRHLPLEVKLNKNSSYINLGDWLGYYTYGLFDGNELHLNKFNLPAL